MLGSAPRNKQRLIGDVSQGEELSCGSAVAPSVEHSRSLRCGLLPSPSDCKICRKLTFLLDPFQSTRFQIVGAVLSVPLGPVVTDTFVGTEGDCRSLSPL